MSRQPNTIFNGFYQDFNQYVVWLKDQVANNKAINLMWKNGFSIEVEEGHSNLDLFLKKFIRDNKLIQHFHEMERICSMWGVAVATINKTKTGEIKLVVADPWYNNNIGLAFDEEVGAVIYKRIQHSNYTFSIREVWDSEKVERFGYDTEGKELSIMDVNALIPEELQLKEKEYHNLGFVPVVMMRNKPNITLFGTSNMVSWLTNADDYGCYKLQYDFENTMAAASLEIINNRTRVFANFSPIEVDGFQQNPYDNPVLKTQWVRNQSTVTKSSPATINQLIQTIQGDPKFDQYNQRLDWIKREYYTGCGYNYDATTAAMGSGDKTATEVSFNNSLDAATTDKKRQVREDDINRLFRKIIAVAEIGYDYKEMTTKQPFTFVINNAIIANLPAQAALGIYEKKKNLGVFSPVDYYQEMHGMTEEQAMEKAEKVKGEQEKYGQQLEKEEEKKPEEGGK